MDAAKNSNAIIHARMPLQNKLEADTKKYLFKRRKRKLLDLLYL